jgi:hypothetical protein
MERGKLDRLQQRFDELVRERFPGAAIERVEVLQYGDDPKIEPGELQGRIVLESGSSEEERKRTLHDFHEAHDDAIREMRCGLDRFPEVGALEFITGGGPQDNRVPVLKMRLERPREALEAAGVPLTPVMARLGPEDLETVDALITAGIAANRAEAVRWALARIRERPAYEKLRERAREIEELKAQF